VDELQQKHGFQLGWMYKVHKNSQADFQIEPFFRTTFAPSPYELQLPAGRENDKLYEYDFGYKSLERLAAKKGHLKVVLIPGRVTLMPLFFKPDDLFSSNSNELQVASDKECFALSLELDRAPFFVRRSFLRFDQFVIQSLDTSGCLAQRMEPFEMLQ